MSQPLHSCLLSLVHSLAFMLLYQSPLFPSLLLSVLSVGSPSYYSIVSGSSLFSSWISSLVLPCFLFHCPESPIIHTASCGLILHVVSVFCSYYNKSTTGKRSYTPRMFSVVDFPVLLD
jgi:hypothetical protein